MRHIERHKMQRVGWLRAAVLGANDGIVSTASLILGVAAAGGTTQSILIAGFAGLAAGAMSMAAGEYVSVSSQADTENADLEREKKELAHDPKHEHAELAAIFVSRGLEKNLAGQVATQLMAHNALGAHAREELGIFDMTTARPIQAAMASAATFGIGASLPLLLIPITPTAWLIPIVSFSSLVLLAVLGALSARTGGAPILKATLRVTFWSALAMGITTGVGILFGIAA